MSVNPSQFEEFFEAVYGFSPFPWQKRLAERVIEGTGPNPWPQCLALPTGAGKTTCLDIAVFSLACQADLPAVERTAPRRIIFVVDRRVIVDEAFEHAVELAKLLCTSDKPILKDVAEALRTIAGHEQLAKINPTFEDAVPLTCHQLRGGMYRDDAWARTPTQPCVIASTVDQIGSRLLFRSYGRSNRTWPVHAGLAGNDSLIILDEAHCANPFFQTMQWISRYRSEQWAETPLRSPFQFVVMSATPPRDEERNEITDIIRDEQEDRDDPVLGRRISTSKPVRLAIATKAKGKHWQKELAVELVKSAFSLVREERLAVALLVNRVATAKLIDQLFELILDPELPVSKPFDERTVKGLRKLLPEGCQSFVHVLMTGRMRPIDKERVADEWLGKLKADPKRQPDAPPILDLECPVFITATQCLEVGANLDFDAMVSECASLDALRQRFGRLNRVGRWDSAPGIIVIRNDQTSTKNPDPVYGESLAATWDWLNGIAESSDKGPFVDFGISRMNQALEAIGEELKTTLVLRGMDAPAMLPAHVDCWVQTQPEPAPTPDVALFLHGPRSGPPELRICWREDLPVSELRSRPSELRERDFREAVALCPPTSRECMPVPLPLFLRWLGEADDANVDTEDLTDIESTADGEAGPFSRSKWAMTLVWRGTSDESQLIRSRNDLKSGDTVIIPAELGGWDVFGHIPGSPIDVAETCHLESRRRPVLRICPALIRGWDIADFEKEALDSAISGEDGQPDWDAVASTIQELLDDQTAGPKLQQLLQHWTILRRRNPENHPLGGLVLRGPRLRLKHMQADKLRNRITTGETFTTEDDTSSEAQRTILLSEHLEGVENHADVFAGITGLSTTLVNSLKLSGRLHDLGKADPRFQAMLHGGHYLKAQLYGELLAKSQGLPVSPNERKTAGQRNSLPDGFRHELLTVQLAENLPELLNESFEFDHDLTLHLITAHHGQGRPFASVIVDEFVSGGSHPEVDDLVAFRFEHNGKDVSVTANQRRQWTPPHRLNSGISDRFWRLVRRYGWWGLAWLEAIFILADHRQSEFEATLMESDEELAETTQ